MKKFILSILFCIGLFASANSQIKLGYPFSTADYEVSYTSTDTAYSISNLETILLYTDSVNTQIQTTTNSGLRAGAKLYILYQNTGVVATPAIYFPNGEMETVNDTISTLTANKRTSLLYTWNGSKWYLTQKSSY